jgi:hypothetical protein
MLSGFSLTDNSHYLMAFRDYGYNAQIVVRKLYGTPSDASCRWREGI